MGSVERRHISAGYTVVIRGARSGIMVVDFRLAHNADRPTLRVYTDANVNAPGYSVKLRMAIARLPFVRFTRTHYSIQPSDGSVVTISDMDAHGNLPPSS
jgi:hypothetical protein